MSLVRPGMYSFSQLCKIAHCQGTKALDIWRFPVDFISNLKLQVRMWTCGRGDVSTPSFGSHLNPISTRGQIMPTLYWCPHQVLKATGVPGEYYNLPSDVMIGRRFWQHYLMPNLPMTTHTQHDRRPFNLHLNF